MQYVRFFHKILECFLKIDFSALFPSQIFPAQYSDIDWDLSDWIYDGSEEYYYYQKPIAPGEDTSCLMTGIYIRPDTPEDEIKNVDVIVYAESYQADGFQDYEEAWKDYSKNLKGDMLYE